MERGRSANSPVEAQAVRAASSQSDEMGEFARIAEGVLAPTPEREVHAIAAGWLDLVRNLAVASAFSYVAGISGAWYMQVLAFVTETALAAYCFTIVFPYLERVHPAGKDAASCPRPLRHRVRRLLPLLHGTAVHHRRDHS